jgi:hypothetical protein
MACVNILITPPTHNNSMWELSYIRTRTEFFYFFLLPSHARQLASLRAISSCFLSIPMCYKTFSYPHFAAHFLINCKPKILCILDRFIINTFYPIVIPQPISNITGFEQMHLNIFFPFLSRIYEASHNITQQIIFYYLLGDKIYGNKDDCLSTSSGFIMTLCNYYTYNYGRPSWHIL